jgi:DNA helicase-2/ATP-dependent DNA helicase PcrA
MTIHSAKGLEFKHLVIAGVEEELFPSQMSTDNPKDLEEERRLFYVALTRAEKSAVITYAALRYKWGIQNSCAPSRFIKEVDTRYLDLPPDFYPLLPGAGQDAPEMDRFVPDSYRKIMERRSQPPNIQVGGRRLVNVNQVTESGTSRSADTSRIARNAGEPGTNRPPKDFIPSSPELIKVGSRVEHPRFGIGEVTIIEGADSNIKATVEFPIGKKQLLLKFAKLRVIE